MSFRTLICLMFTIFSVFISSSLFSQEIVDVAEYLVENNSSCVTQISGEKVYIDAERIFPSNEGLYLRLDSENFISLPYLRADTEGCYLAISTKVTLPCRFCGTERVSSAIPCPNKECPSRKENKNNQINA
ncbi:MAG: hypothetical protein P0S96_07995 [Simkaniaceae bacterium]|nr:hypothetical protein [Candidatus Sacchlamyda saccharinae]